MPSSEAAPEVRVRAGGCDSLLRARWRESVPAARGPIRGRGSRLTPAPRHPRRAPGELVWSHPVARGAPLVGHRGAWMSHKTSHWIASEFGAFKFSNSYVSRASALRGSGAPRDPPPPFHPRPPPLGVLGSRGLGGWVFPGLRGVLERRLQK